MHALGRAEEPGYRPRGNTSVLGPLTGVIIIVIAVLMVWKPGD